MGLNTIIGVRMSSFSNSDGILIIKNLITAIQKNKQYLSDIDGMIGDGDHGINMNKGFTLCAKELEANENLNLSEGLLILSKILMMKIGGSMGPLYGFFFKSMGEKCVAKDMIDQASFGEMFEAVPISLSKISKAKVGDKSLMDCLLPAVDAYKRSFNKGNDFNESLTAMCNAAQVGRDSTKDMVSKVGRSSRLGERSRGVIDAGATSCALIICSMAESINELISK